MAPTERTIRQFRSYNFKGEHRSLPDLVDTYEYADACINMRVDDLGNLVGTAGFSVASSEFVPVDTRFISAVQTNNHGLFKFFRPVRTLGSLSAPEEVMIAIGGKGSIQYKTGSVLITPPTGGSISFYAYQTGSGGTYVLDLIKSDGTVQASKTFNVGSANFATENLEFMRAWIAAQAGWACTLTPSGTVNATAARGYNNGIPVTGSNIAIGDIVRIKSASFPSGVADVFVTDVSGGNVYCAGLTADVNVVTGDKIGCGLLPALTVMPICYRKVPNRSDGAIEIPILLGASPAPYDSYFDIANIENSARRATGASLNGTLYIGSKRTWGNYQNRLCKFDGVCLGYAGAAKQSSCTIAAVAGGALTTGAVYRYAVVLEKIDANDFVIRSQPFELSLPAIVAGTATARITIPANSLEYEVQTATTNTVAAAPTATIAVTGWDLFNGASFGVGEYVHVPSNADPKVLQRAKITAVRGNQISVSPSVTVNGAVNSGLAQGGKIILFKTVANGDIFYKFAEVVPRAVSQTIDDANAGTSADTAVVANERLTFPPIGLENDPPPALSIVTTHQDLLVGAGATDDPSAVYFSTSESPEYMPVASNSQSVPDTSNGVITALCSDTGSRLSIFKDRATYSAIGDFRVGNVLIEDLSSGGVGCPSPNGVIKNDKWTYFISRRGICRMQNGVIDEGFNAATVDWFSKNENLYGTTPTFISPGNNFNFTIQHTCCVDDTERRRLIFRVPSEGGDAAGLRNGLPSSGKQTAFCFDYQREAWTRLVSDSDQMPSVGLVVFKNRLYGSFVGSSSNLSRFLTISGGILGLNDSQSTLDFSCVGANVISSFLALRADGCGAPHVKKEWIDGLVYCTGAIVGPFTPPPSGTQRNYLPLVIIGKENYDPIDKEQMNIQIPPTTSPTGALRHTMTTELTPTEIAGSAAVSLYSETRVFEPMAAYFRFANNQAVAMKLIITNVFDKNYANQVNRPLNISGIDINVALPYKMDAVEKAARWK